MKSRVQTQRFCLALLALCSVLLAGLAGCRSHNTDNSDPDPHYYKGTDFHGRPAKH